MGTRFAVAAGLVLTLLPSAAGAWSGPVHMAIVTAAYQGLPHADRAAVNAILAMHPRFDEWAADWSPNLGVNLGLYVAMRGSLWPDELRDPHYAHAKRDGECLVQDGAHVTDPARQAEREAYDHPDRHFINYPLVPPAFAPKPPPSTPGDIVRAIAESQRALRDPSTSAQDRAAALAWLIHLVADIHQPEHCVALFGAAFPYGDRGGNWFYAKTPTREPFKLHAYWDNPLHLPADLGAVRNAAADLQGDPSLARGRLRELAQARTPRSWALESAALAINLVYLRGALKPAPARFALNPKSGLPELKSVDLTRARNLPAGYESNARAAARKRMALAAYRLADELAAAVQRSIPDH